MITKGDENRIEEDKKNQTKVRNNVFMKIVASLIFDIICALITNAIV